jgi:hypothetical protein
MSNSIRKQDLKKENFGKLGVNFQFAINPGLTNANCGLVPEQLNTEFVTPLIRSS